MSDIAAGMPWAWTMATMRLECKILQRGQAHLAERGDVRVSSLPRRHVSPRDRTLCLPGLHVVSRERATDLRARGQGW